MQRFRIWDTLQRVILVLVPKVLVNIVDYIDRTFGVFVIFRNLVNQFNRNVTKLR